MNDTGDWRWIPDKTEVYVPGKVIRTSGKKLEVELRDGTLKTCNADEAKNFNRSSLQRVVGDLVRVRNCWYQSCVEVYQLGWVRLRFRIRQSQMKSLLVNCISPVFFLTSLKKCLVLCFGRASWRLRICLLLGILLDRFLVEISSGLRLSTL